MKKVFLLAATLLAATAVSASAENDGLATIHEWRSEGGRTCMSDHFHDGAGSGPTRKSAEAAAISSWASFTAFEYSNNWARYSLAGSKKMDCSQNGADAWSCSVSARPCKPGRAARRKR